MMRIYNIICACFLLLTTSAIVCGTGNESQISEPFFIDLTISENSIEIGDTFLIEGYIVPSLLSHPGDRILLQVTSPKGSRAGVYYQQRVNSEGLFNLEMNADAIGDWSFNARYGEYSSPSVPLKVTPRLRVKETELTLSGPFNTVFKGDNVQMSGWLRDIEGNGIGYRQVSYSFGLPSYSCALCEDDTRRIWQTLGPVTTDEIGYFEFSFPARDNGKYAVKATFPGDEIYGQSDSEIVYPVVL